MAAALGALWASAAFADWPFGKVARLQPGFGGVCEDCDLSGRILVGVRITNGIFRRSNFSRAVLARADASGSVFEQANFTDADLSHAKLIGAHCAHARFPNAVLTASDATNADFTGANFEHAVLDDSRLVAATFDDADMRRASLNRTNLSGVDLRRTHGLIQRQLRAACGDALTRLPRGLTIPRCVSGSPRRG